MAWWSNVSYVREGRRDRLIAHDHIWAKICDYLKWEFIRSV